MERLSKGVLHLLTIFVFLYTCIEYLLTYTSKDFLILFYFATTKKSIEIFAVQKPHLHQLRVSIYLLISRLQQLKHHIRHLSLKERF